LETPFQIMAMRGALSRVFSKSAQVKAALKVATGKRSLYAVSEGANVIHYGWIMDSSCRQYRVEPNDLVIGPIWSHPESRGRGAATYGTKAVMNRFFERGRRVFFIDTSSDNVSCLRMIEKCGFGDPVATYLRD